MSDSPEAILVLCEGKTEVLYFNILKKRFRLPTFVKILPDLELREYRPLGQHERLIRRAHDESKKLEDDLGEGADIETWVVCDRDEYNDSFTKLRDFADSLDVSLAFSDPQFENFLLQHFSQNKSRLAKSEVERELSDEIMRVRPNFGLYNKSDLAWLDEMIDEKHSIVRMAIKNADVFSRHTRQPFFTVQRLVRRLIDLV